MKHTASVRERKHLVILSMILVLMGLAFASAQQGDATPRLHEGRMTDGRVARFTILRDHGNGFYDVILEQTGTTQRRVRIIEVYSVAAAANQDGDEAAASTADERLPTLAARAERELEDLRRESSTVAAHRARQRLETTLRAALRKSESLGARGFTLDDGEAFLQARQVAERHQFQGPLAAEFSQLQRLVNNWLVDKVVGECAPLVRRGEFTQALDRLERVEPFLVGANQEREVDRLRTEARVGLARNNLHGGADRHPQALRRLQDALNARHPGARAQAALALAQYSLQTNAPDQARVHLDLAQTLRPHLSDADRLQVDRLELQVAAALRQARDAPAVQAQPNQTAGLRPASTLRASPAPLRPGMGEQSPFQPFDFQLARYWYEGEEWQPLLFHASVNLLGLIVVYLLVWHWPSAAYIKHARRKFGYEDLKRSRLARGGGLPMVLVLLALDSMKRPDKTVCPSCKANLDNPEAFGDLAFEVCPFCGKRIKPIYTLDGYIEVLARSLDSMRDRQAGGEASGSEESRATMSGLISAVITKAVRERASDVHIEPEAARCLVRFRVDGILHEALSLPSRLHGNLVAALKGMAQMDVTERRMPQDGHFHQNFEDVAINVRISTMPISGGEKMVLRLLDPRHALMPPERMGFSPGALKQFQECLQSAHGLFITSGPTGSGKTTLLYAAIAAINDGRRSIFTIEDPIEFQLTGVNQIHNNPATGLTFATALRSILRQDPDVIMVGEIRDAETAKIAVHAAQTGHLVFTTLHTLDTATAISRLTDLQVEPRAAAHALLCIVAQRLVRTICPQCRQPRTLTEDHLHRLRLDRAPSAARISAGEGCPGCGGSGFVGRTGLYELLEPKASVRKLMESGASGAAIRQASIQAGMKTLRQEAIKKLYEGVTTVDEVLRVTADLEEDESSLSHINDT